MRMNAKALGSLLLVTLPIVALSLTGCSRPVLDYRNIQVINGKIYAGDANTPFSGTVTNVPDNWVLQSQDEFAQIAELIVRAADPQEVQAGQNLGVSWAGMLTVSATSYCDMSVRDGWLDGKATCKAPRSDDTTTVMNFKEGRLYGDFTFFDSLVSPHLLAEAKFNEKGADGTLKVYSPKTGKLIVKADFDDGVMDGAKEVFNADTGDLTFKGHLKQGQLDGESVQYTPDGKTKVEIIHWSNGTKAGDQDKFDATTGNKVLHGSWSNGKINGVVQAWDAQGKLLKTEHYVDGVAQADPAAEPAPVADPGSNVADSNALTLCVNKWVNAYHTEQGQEALIAADQLDEWKGWCQQGKEAPGA